MAIVSNASNGQPLLNLSGINFGPSSCLQGVMPYGNDGAYTVAYDDTSCAELTCSVYGYQLNTQSLNGGPAEVIFAMVPIQGFTVQFQLVSGGPYVAPASVSVFVDVYGNVGLPLQSGTINWGDGQSTILDVSSVANGGKSFSHTYGSCGTYQLQCAITDGNKVQESSSLSVTVTCSSSPPPTSQPPLIIQPCAVVAAYNQGNLGNMPRSPTLFAVRELGNQSDTHLYQHTWNEETLQWKWHDNGPVPGAGPTMWAGPLFQSPSAGLGVVVNPEGGSDILEYSWDPTTLSWGWGPNLGVPPGGIGGGTQGAGAVIYPPFLGTVYVLNDGNGQLWVDAIDQGGQWTWTSLGAPPGTTVSYPGAVFNSADAGTRIMVTAANGQIYELALQIKREVTPGTRYTPPRTFILPEWNWIPHGAPPLPIDGQSFGAVDAPNTPGAGIRFFVVTIDHHIWANCLDQKKGTWSWVPCGLPPGQTLPVLAGPVLFNSPDAGIRVILTSWDFSTSGGTFPAGGSIYEYSFDAASSTWGWIPHLNPPGTTAASAPGCPLDSQATGIKFFVGGADGNLWENYLDPTSGGWGWRNHGAP